MGIEEDVQFVSADAAAAVLDGIDNAVDAEFGSEREYAQVAEMVCPACGMVPDLVRFFPPRQHLRQLQ